MSRNRTSAIFVWTLAFIVVLASVGCQKLNVRKLSANYYFSKANQLFKDGRAGPVRSERLLDDLGLVLGGKRERKGQDRD